MRVTLKTINDQLKSLGSDARLEKGDGYFYFTSGEAASWLNPTVRVPTLASLSLEEWVDKFLELRKLSQSLSGPAKATSPESKRPKKQRDSRK
jgi:hypothetical protein